MKLFVTFHPQKLVINFPAPKLDIFFKNPIIRDGSNLDPYTGEYIVTPMVDVEQVLNTNGLRMTDDVTVLKIPYYETSNLSGGFTAIIGG